MMNTITVMDMKRLLLIHMKAAALEYLAKNQQQRKRAEALLKAARRLRGELINRMGCDAYAELMDRAVLRLR